MVIESILRRWLNSSCDEDDEHFDIEYEFLNLYLFCCFLVALYVSGKICAPFNVPPVVGEIIVGIIVGPNFLELAPHSKALKMLGECGLILLVIEAGIEVDLEVLKLIGGRGVMVAVFGSVVPVSIGFGLGQALGFTAVASLAMGACLAPTSVGIALDVLKRGEVLNTNIGQLVIAAAVLDDIISLVLLGVIQSLKNPTAWNLMKPLVASLGFLLIFGYIAVAWMPMLLPKLYECVDKDSQKWIRLGFVFAMTMVMIPTAHYAGTSYLLGAFVSGLCLCTDHEAHKVWHSTCQRVMTWLMRLFFACTIGFEVPIRDVWEAEIISHTWIFFSCLIGKIATGIFAPNFDLLEGLKLGFAMSAWGEFAFILATTSKSEGILNEKQFSTITMAVLLSVIVGPICLSYSIELSKQRQSHIQLTEPLMESGTEGPPPIGGEDPMSSISLMSMPGATTLPIMLEYERRHSWWRKASDDEDDVSDKKKLEHTTMLLPARQKCEICGRATSYACFACSMEATKEGLPTLCHPAKKGKRCWKIWHDRKAGRIGFGSRRQIIVQGKCGGPQPIGATSLSVNNVPRTQPNFGKAHSTDGGINFPYGYDANQTM